MCRLLAVFHMSLVLLPITFALVCYDNTKASNSLYDNIRAENCTKCDYCVVSVDPARPNTDSETSLFATGMHIEDTNVLSAIFAQNDDMYEVLTACVLEKYTIGSQVQYLMRCYCAHDGCNKAYNLNDFLARTKVNDELSNMMKPTQ